MQNMPDTTSFVALYMLMLYNFRRRLYLIYMQRCPQTPYNIQRYQITCTTTDHNRRADMQFLVVSVCRWSSLIAVSVNIPFTSSSYRLPLPSSFQYAFVVVFSIPLLLFLLKLRDRTRRTLSMVKYKSIGVSFKGLLLSHSRRISSGKVSLIALPAGFLLLLDETLHLSVDLFVALCLFVCVCVVEELCFFFSLLGSFSPCLHSSLNQSHLTAALPRRCVLFFCF